MSLFRRDTKINKTSGGGGVCSVLMVFGIFGVTSYSMTLTTSLLINTPRLAKLLLVGLTSVANKQLVLMTEYLVENL